MLRRFNAWVDRQHIVVQASVWITIIFLIRTFGFGLYVVPSPSMETTMLVGERFIADKCSLWIRGIQHGDVISFNDPRFEYSENPVMNWWQRYVGVSPWGWGPSNWTKRVIGLPGDHIKGTIEDGKPVVYRNGEKLEEPYINDHTLISLWGCDTITYSSGRRPIEHRSYDPNKKYKEQPFYTIDPTRIVRLPGMKTFIHPFQPVSEDIDTYDVQLGEDEYWVMGDNRLASHDSRFWGPLKGHLIHGKIKFCIFSIDSEYSWWIMHLIVHPIDFFTKVRWDRTFKIVQ